MAFRAGVQLFGLMAAAVVAATPVLGRSNSFLNAVAFALTGSDATPVRVVDQANCVFMVNPKTENGRIVGEVFHLNNIQTDRISIQPWENVLGRWVQVELRGSSTIYEYTGAYNTDATNPLVTPEQQEKLQSLVQPRQSASFTLKLDATETDRVVRAWRYIYSNGCKGSRSSF
jgi:hypothetical protein